jgi:hypothetical protein
MKSVEYVLRIFVQLHAGSIFVRLNIHGLHRGIDSLAQSFWRTIYITTQG